MLTKAQQKALLAESRELNAKKHQTLIANDKELAAMMPKPKVSDDFLPEAALELELDKIFSAYSERKALGERAYEIVQNPEGEQVRQYKKAFKFLSYKEYQSQVHALASAWINEASLSVKRDELVAILGFGGIQFSAISTACYYVQAVVVPLQSNTSGADLAEIFTKINPSILAATIKDLKLATDHAIQHGSIPVLLAFDYDERVDSEKKIFEQCREKLKAANCTTRLVQYNEVIQVGQQKKWEYIGDHGQNRYERTALIIHSSGSTGKPKGAMLSEAALLDGWNPQKDKFPSIMVFFAPLNHGMGFRAVMFVLRKGSYGCFTLQPDMSTLFEDIRIVRPTLLRFYPRILESIYQYFQNKVGDLIKKGVLQEEAEQDVMSAMRTTFLGDRFITGSVGSAPITETVKQFTIDCFDIVLIEGYGNTETGSGALTYNGLVVRPNVIDYKLDDVPELGYFKTDKPYPRGEFVFKSKFQTMGYFKDPETTAQLFDEEGYVHTGDIVELREQDYIVIVDRRKDVTKLSQGEYVAVGPLGAVFEAGSSVINQIYIYGNASQAYLLAVVVPDNEAVEAVLGKEYSQHDLKSLIHTELKQVAVSSKLKAFEVPRDFIIEQEAFSQDNGLLSSVRKRLRPALNRKYSPALDALYEQHAEQTRKNYDALKSDNNELSILEKLTKLIEIQLNREIRKEDYTYTFYELGGDSLSAVSFSMAIQDVFGLSVGADVILSPANNLKKWAAAMESRMDTPFTKPTFATIHGEDAQELNAADLKLSAFLGEQTIEAVASIGALSANEKTVFITGGNGFLGHHVVLQWMQRLAPLGGKVICLVRGKNKAHAQERLFQIFENTDQQLKKIFDDLATNHLEVIAGDIGASLLGMDEATFRRVGEEADRIVHVAALVNHRLAYRHLFTPNVAGTAEIIRLAVTHHKKPIDFVSTEASLRFSSASNGESNETAPLKAIVPLMDERYAGGYAVSKWAGETLLKKAYEQFVLPINILRGNMMLAHQSYSAEINYADTFTRLLYSVALTGLAPISFYLANGKESKQQVHYDGFPVDVVAAAVVASANFKHTDFQAFNIHNFHHDDGGHLDAFMNWVESAGYAITRLPHSEWVERFENKLKSYPEEIRKNTALDVLASYRNLRGGERQTLVPDSDNFQRLMKSSVFSSAIPHIDETFIHKCMRDIAARYGSLR